MGATKNSSASPSPSSSSSGKRSPTCARYSRRHPAQRPQYILPPIAEEIHYARLPPAAFGRGAVRRRSGLCWTSTVCSDRSGLSRQWERSSIRGRAIFEHGLGDRPLEQQESWGHSAGRPPADEFIAPLQRPGSCPWAWFLSGSQDTRGRFDRLELGDIRRYRQSSRQAYD